MLTAFPMLRKLQFYYFCQKLINHDGFNQNFINSR